MHESGGIAISCADFSDDHLTYGVMFAILAKLRAHCVSAVKNCREVGFDAFVGGLGHVASGSVGNAGGVATS